MGEKTKKVIKFLFPVFFFLLLGIVLFWPYFTKGLVPIPADILIGHYHPWKDEVWDGRIAGYPIKNFQLFDGILQTLPWRLLAIESFKAGNLPLWNPYVICGMPLLANLQVAILYP